MIRVGFMHRSHVRTRRCHPRALAASALLLGMCTACDAARTGQRPIEPSGSMAPTAAFTPRDDCDWASETICDGPPMPPGPMLQGAATVAAVHVETVDPTLFNTVDGRPPDQPYDPERQPQDTLQATVEAVFGALAGPDWLDREWDETMVSAEATASAIEDDFYARWRELHPFDLGHLVVMRVEPDPGVLRGEPDLGWVVSVRSGGRAEVTEGRHAGCTFEATDSGCQTKVDPGQSGLALLRPVDAARAENGYFHDHCAARAAEVERATGAVARCMELAGFLPAADGGWRWTGGMGDGVLDPPTVFAMMRGDEGAPAETGGGQAP